MGTYIIFEATLTFEKQWEVNIKRPFNVGGTDFFDRPRSVEEQIPLRFSFVPSLNSEDLGIKDSFLLFQGLSTVRAPKIFGTLK